MNYVTHKSHDCTHGPLIIRLGIPKIAITSFSILYCASLINTASQFHLPCSKSMTLCSGRIS